MPNMAERMNYVSAVVIPLADSNLGLSQLMLDDSTDVTI